MRRLLISVLLLGLATWAGSQPFTSWNVKLYKWFDLVQLTAASGNHCWGYVSPSGREYAIMGCDNKTAFVEITDPENAVYFASIAHGANLWSDIKVYQNFCYVVTERIGSGIQVINLSNIDNHVVTLERTIASPGRSHTVGLDPVSGYLYTHGSRDGTGTTMCFDLTNPANPQQVGMNSLTANYMHDAQEVTYTSGPYAGRQILFGCSEGRGLDIYDVTNKSATFLIKRVPYPLIGYCHQGWLDPERKYFYINDEFDESNNGFTTRTIVINVESLETAFYAGSFTTGLESIDHNLYMAGRYIHEANYRTGLQIWDTNSGGVTPTRVGWFDTYPEDDLRGYNGAWSTYPFFPSRTVLISDIERGLFVLDASDALSKASAPTALTFVRGSATSGGLPNLVNSDDSRLVARPGPVPISTHPPLVIELESNVVTDDTLRIVFGIESSCNVSNVRQSVELYDFETDTWVKVLDDVLPSSDTAYRSDQKINSSRFIRDSDRRVRARLSYKPQGATAIFPWNVRIDQVYWTVLPRSPMI